MESRLLSLSGCVGRVLTRHNPPHNSLFPQQAPPVTHSSPSGTSAKGGDEYLGQYIGRLSTLHHLVTGDVYAITNTSILIKGFSYDGEAPGQKGWSGS